MVPVQKEEISKLTCCDDRPPILGAGMQLYREGGSIIFASRSPSVVAVFSTCLALIAFSRSVVGNVTPFERATTVKTERLWHGKNNQS